LLLSPILLSNIVLYVLQALRIEAPIPIRVALTRIVVPLVGIVFGPRKGRLLHGWLHEGSGTAKAKESGSDMKTANGQSPHGKSSAEPADLILVNGRIAKQDGRSAFASALTGAGTDATRVASYNPWVALHLLVTGRTVGGASLYEAENRHDRSKELRLYTLGSSWFSGEEEKKGAIASGRLDDLAVLSADDFSVAEPDIARIGVHRWVARCPRTSLWEAIGCDCFAFRDQ
jgi:hypothetical protein